MKSGLNHIICVTVFLFSSLITKAQTGNWTSLGRPEMAKLFDKMNNWFKNTASYSLIITHASYENYNTMVPVERSVGYFKKDKNDYHSFLLGIHTVQNSVYKIVIDSSEKIMMVANPDQLTWNTYTAGDYEVMLKNCVAVKKMNNSVEKKYRIEFAAGSAISHYEFVFDQDEFLKEVISYYGLEIKKDGDDKNSPKVKPRISILFSGYKISPVLNYKEEFDESKYFFRKNGKLVPAERYRTFKLSDQRIYKKTE